MLTGIKLGDDHPKIDSQIFMEWSSSVKTKTNILSLECTIKFKYFLCINV